MQVPATFPAPRILQALVQTEHKKKGKLSLLGITITCRQSSHGKDQLRSPLPQRLATPHCDVVDSCCWSYQILRPPLQAKRGPSQPPTPPFLGVFLWYGEPISNVPISRRPMDEVLGLRRVWRFDTKGIEEAWEGKRGQANKGGGRGLPLSACAPITGLAASGGQGVIKGRDTSLGV